ncbi:hypothetical protein C4572_02290 [Candidatus Parcubacteria bacterium]|nr:MAG: hypothetical protein C4572_02290 [Candidatus Parcubacteria bacterium]
MIFARKFKTAAGIFAACLGGAALFLFFGNNALAQTNLVSNPSLETEVNGLPQDWFKGRWGTNTAIFTYPVAGTDGSKAAKVELTSRTSGDAKWYFKEVAAGGGKTYKFSNSYMSSIPSVLTARYKMSDGTYKYADLANLSASSGWKTGSAEFTAPAGTAGISIFHLINQVGSLTVDNYNLSEVVSAPSDPNNKVANPSLEIAGSSSSPQDWFKGRWGTNTAVFTYPTAGFDGSKAAKVELTSRTSGDAKWYFKEVAVTPGKTYRFTNYSMSDALSYLTVQYRTKSGSLFYRDLATVPASSAWKKSEVDFKIPDEVASLTIFHLIKEVGGLTVDKYDLREVASSPAPSGLVSLNFDDGWITTYQNALPILNAAGLKSTQYISSGRFDFSTYVNIDQMLDMQAKGHEIGSHTKTHANLTILSTEEMRDEIIGSKEDLLAAGVNSVTTFAYPFGAYNESVVAVVEEAGYKGARRTQDGFNDSGSNRFLLNRFSVESDTAFAEAKGWIDSAMSNGTWAVIVFHRVDYSGTRYATTPEVLQQIVDYLKEKNARVVTMDEGMDIVF